ncbi:hypothetical protein [Hymenobacter algoricola]
MKTLLFLLAVWCCLGLVQFFTGPASPSAEAAKVRNHTAAPVAAGEVTAR